MVEISLKYASAVTINRAWRNIRIILQYILVCEELISPVNKTRFEHLENHRRHVSEE